MTRIRLLPASAGRRHRDARNGQRERRGRSETRRWSRSGGAALPIVLMLSSMMLTTSAAWFETSIAAARSAANLHDQLLAFHAADSALALCAKRIVAGTVSVAGPAAAAEPVAWKLPAVFEAAAFAPVASWPGAVLPPQCFAETWRLATRADAQAWLVTVRGYGRTRDSQVWLQLQLVIDGDTVERHWRRIAARPF
ncbi:MAG TPA: hypothetical protein VGL08_13980 [Paraburkholderia sp.]|jgi:hypothetical protein